MQNRIRSRRPMEDFVVEVFMYMVVIYCVTNLSHSEQVSVCSA